MPPAAANALPWVTLVATVGVQLLGFAYFSGRYSQLITDLKERLASLEGQLNALETSHAALSREVHGALGELKRLSPRR